MPFVPAPDGLVRMLGIQFTVVEPGHVEATMPISDDIKQPFGYVHGGATLALLETVASKAAEFMCDFEVARPFGITIDVRHRKAGVAGMMRGVAELDHEEGNKQFWRVAAYDDEGDVMSDGTFMSKVVTLERLEEKRREREAEKAGRASH